jgi:hypothetical protein
MSPFDEQSVVPRVASAGEATFGPASADTPDEGGALDAVPGTSQTWLPHRTTFPPIDDYAFLSDCETTCLIARNGAVEWMCIPRPDSPSIFGAVLDRGAGHFRIGPYGQNVPAARRYLPGGLIVETTWQTETGWLVVRDALVMG